MSKRKKTNFPRKIRTREHVIADLSTNYVERFALKAGFSVQRVSQDYGYDLIVTTHNSNGEIENGNIFIQMKATDGVKIEGKKSKLVFSLDTRDVNLWMSEIYPAILIIYDANLEKAYWYYIQNKVESGDLQFKSHAKSVRVKVDIKDYVDQSTFAKFRKFKENIANQILVGDVKHA